MKVAQINKDNDLLEKGAEFFWKCWGTESNFNFYKDCIVQSVNNSKTLPKFYVLLDNQEIIGSYALLINDIISRQDLCPWLACLYIDEQYRNKGLAANLIEDGIKEALKYGYDTLYLSTNLNGFYERKGWTFIGTGYNVFGGNVKIYSKNLIADTSSVI